MSKIFSLIFSIFSVSILLSCSQQEQKEVKASETDVRFPSVNLTKEQVKLMDIKIQPLDEKLIYPTLITNGLIKPKPNHEASVTARIEGMVDKIYILEGNSVKKGEPMFLVSSPALVQLQQDFMNASANKNLFQLEYERQSELRKNNVGSIMDLQASENKYFTAVASFKSLEQTMKMQGLNPDDFKNPLISKVSSTKTITAPIDGFVFKLNTKVGMNTEPATVLAEIIDLSELHADIFCYEKDLAIVGENQDVEIQFINKSIPAVTGKIYKVSRTVDKDTRSVIMHTVFKSPKGFLIMPEMAISAKIKAKNSGVMSKTVPLTAIFEQTEQSFIYYTNISDTTGVYKFRKAKVTTGNNDGKNVEIVFEETVPHRILIATSNVANLEGEFSKIESK